MLAEAWRFLGRYWRRAPGPAVLSIPVAMATVMTFQKEQGLLNLMGLVGMFLLVTMAMGAAWRLGGQDLEPERSDLALGPFGIQFGTVERKALGATLLLIGAAVVLNLILSVFDRPVNATRSTLVFGTYLVFYGCLMIYLFGRLALFAPRAGLGRGFGLSKSWRLTRASMLPLAVIFLAPQLLSIPLGAIAYEVLPSGLGNVFLDPVIAILMLVYLAISPFVWGAQIAMLRVLEPVIENPPEA